MADLSYRQNNTNGLLVAVLAIIVLAALAFGIYWMSNSDSDTSITLPETNRVELNMPEAPEAPELPTPPTPANP